MYRSVRDLQRIRILGLIAVMAGIAAFRAVRLKAV
jgi:hypothetical protein